MSQLKMVTDTVEKNPDDVSETSISYDVMIPLWDKINTVTAGTSAMRVAAQLYLPQHKGEDDDNYAERLSTSVLFPKTEKTLEELAAKPFSDDMKIKDGTPDEIRGFMENDIDLLGNKAAIFYQSWFRDGIKKGFSHVLIDIAQPQTEEGVERTREDDRVEGRRPYMVHVLPEQVIFMASSVIGGVERLTDLRIREEVKVINGYAESIVHQIRAHSIGEVVVYQREEEKQDHDEDAWREIERYETGLDVIPFVTFYVDRLGLQLAKPPLEDLGDLNVAHWQSSSDQQNILKVARFPILSISGERVRVQRGPDGKAVAAKSVIGPRQVMRFEDPQAKMGYVEHTGKAIAAGRTELLDLEEQMGMYGSQFTRRQSGNQTATQRTIDSAEAVSTLQAWAMAFEDAAEEAQRMMLQYLPDAGDVPGRIKLNHKATVNDTSDSELTALDRGRTRKDISREAWAAEMLRRGVLSEDYDVEADKELIDAEPALFNLDPGGEDDDGEDDDKNKDDRRADPDNKPKL